MRNEKGIALIMVLGAIVIVTAIVVDFAYNAHVAYQLAASERNRLQAYYLARSALHLSRLELKVERQMKAQFAEFLKGLKDSGLGTGISADPLCKQIPLSTNLLRGFAGEAVEGAEEFLTFEGDFEALCDTEERKINLNVFRSETLGTLGSLGTAAPEGGTTAGPSVYEEQKQLLTALMLQKEFESVFGGKVDEVRKVVNQIADWADRNDRIDESPGITGGAEDSEYREPEANYKVKNGKFATVAELLLVADVGDDLYQKLAPYVTVYGDNKIHLCQSSEGMIRAFVFKYMQSAGLAPIPPEDEKKWSDIVLAVRLACDSPLPKPADVANAVLAALGSSPSANLAKYITTTNRFYRIEATGKIKDSQVKISSVIDTAQANPNLWKALYFRVE